MKQLLHNAARYGEAVRVLRELVLAPQRLDEINGPRNA
jgi:hypothetical protein